MKRLLITIGDSWTHGVGCYDEDLMTQYLNKEIGLQELYNKSKEHFYKFAWPTYTAKKLNANLINLGLGGYSNSAIAKSFIKNEHKNYRKEYDEILVVMLITDPLRFSFYNNGEIQSFLIHSKDRFSELTEKYLEFCMNNVGLDGGLETAFYLNCVESFCKANSYNFYYGSIWHDFSKIEPFFSSDGYLHINQPLPHNFVSKYKHKDYYSWDGHFNKIGYEVLGTHIANILQTNYNL